VDFLKREGAEFITSELALHRIEPTWILKTVSFRFKRWSLSVVRFGSHCRPPN